MSQVRRLGHRLYCEAGAIGIFFKTPKGVAEIRVFAFSTPHGDNKVLDVNLILLLDGRPVYSEVRRELATREEAHEQALCRLISYISDEPEKALPVLRLVLKGSMEEGRSIPESLLS